MSVEIGHLQQQILMQMYVTGFYKGSDQLHVDGKNYTVTFDRENDKFDVTANTSSTSKMTEAFVKLWNKSFKSAPIEAVDLSVQLKSVLNEPSFSQRIWLANADYLVRHKCIDDATVEAGKQKLDEERRQQLMSEEIQTQDEQLLSFMEKVFDASGSERVDLNQSTSLIKYLITNYRTVTPLDTSSITNPSSEELASKGVAELVKAIHPYLIHQ
ncbi:MAG: hypothetical protein ACPGUD_10930 [Parashewanella sp.]